MYIQYCMALETVLIMRFPEDVKEALRAAAKVERRSMSNLTLGILAEWLEAREYLSRQRPSKKGKR